MTVHVLGVRATQVRVGIDAPRSVPVVRSELAMRYVDPPIISPSADALHAIPALEDILAGAIVVSGPEPMWRCAGCDGVGLGRTSSIGAGAIGHAADCRQTFTIVRAS